MTTLNTEQLIENFLNDIDHRFNEGRDESILDTGFNNLDEAIWGMHCGDVLLFQGAPRSGKTALALNILHNVSMRGGATLLISNSDKNEEIMMKIIALTGMIDIDKFRSGKLNESDWSKLNNGINAISKWNITFHSGKKTMLKSLPELTSSKLKQDNAKNSEMESPVDLIIIDDLHLNKEFNIQTTKSLVALKDMAIKLNIPIVATSSTSPVLEKEIIKENRYIKETHYEPILDYVDLGFKILGPTPGSSLSSSYERLLELLITKNKRGEKKVIKLDFHSGFMKIAY